MAGKPPLAQGPTADLLIQHFTHQQHPLRIIYIAEEFNCDGCNTLGFGTRFRCSSCDFDLHQRCAESPFILSSPLHPPHQLTLVNVPGKQHFCNICGATANGLLYTCQACDFDVHPLCTQTPMIAHHAPHPHHLLTFQPGNPAGICGGCGGTGSGSSWWYRCGACNVDVHRECVVQQVAAAAVATTSYNVAPLPQTHVGYVQPASTARWVPPPQAQPGTVAQYGGYVGGVNYQQPVNNQGRCYGGGGGGGGRVNYQQPVNNQAGYYGGGSGCAGGVNFQQPANNQGYYGGGGGGNGKEKSNMYSKVGKFAVDAVVTSLIGFPIDFGSKK